MALLALPLVPLLLGLMLLALQLGLLCLKLVLSPRLTAGQLWCPRLFCHSASPFGFQTTKKGGGIPLVGA